MGGFGSCAVMHAYQTLTLLPAATFPPLAQAMLNGILTFQTVQTARRAAAGGSPPAEAAAAPQPT